MNLTFNELIEIVDSVLQEYPEEFLLDDWKNRKTDTDHYTFGNCYVVSEVLWRMSKELENPPKLKICKGVVGDINHYWLIDKETARIYDLTADQFRNGQFAGEEGETLLLNLYANGRGTSLQNTSNRAKGMMELVREKIIS